MDCVVALEKLACAWGAGGTMCYLQRHRPSSFEVLLNHRLRQGQWRWKAGGWKGGGIETNKVRYRKHQMHKQFNLWCTTCTSETIYTVISEAEQRKFTWLFFLSFFKVLFGAAVFPLASNEESIWWPCVERLAARLERGSTWDELDGKESESTDCSACSLCSPKLSLKDYPL